MKSTAPSTHRRTALVAAVIVAVAALPLLAVDVPDSYIDYVESTEAQYVDLTFDNAAAEPGNWTARLSTDGKTCRIIPKGFVIIVK